MKKNFTVADLPRSERPRERLQQFGSETLSVQELFALILGNGSPGESVMIMSQRLVSHFGSLKTLQDVSLEDLCAIKGIGQAKAARIKACFEIAKRVSFAEEPVLKQGSKRIHSPCEVYNLVKKRINGYSKEHFFVLSFDTRNNFIGIDETSMGILDASLVHPRETFEAAIRRHAAKIIIAHNHPSGDTEPSDHDTGITKRLSESGKLIGIDVIDHIIITKKAYFSFKEHALL